MFLPEYSNAVRFFSEFTDFIKLDQSDYEFRFQPIRTRDHDCDTLYSFPINRAANRPLFFSQMNWDLNWDLSAWLLDTLIAVVFGSCRSTCFHPEAG